MRTKDELLTESRRAISKAPKEGQEMLAHEFLMLEVFIDIRDILDRGTFHILDLIQEINDKL